MLTACRSAQIEAASCLSLGLVRPAIFTIRLQFELFLAWLYFNDHPIEWATTKRGELDFPMRQQNISYLDRHDARFKARFALLSKYSSRSDKTPYKTLSNFVHGSTIDTMPDSYNPSTLVKADGAVDACVALQCDVSEYLSDVASSWLTSRWMDYPAINRADVEGRLAAGKLKEFCSVI